VYGTYRVTGVDERGKKLGVNPGDRATKAGRVTIELWESHVSGRQSLGITPIRDDATCVFGAADVDDYTIGSEGRKEIVKKLADLALPVVPCRSKSGGLHLYMFASEPVPARVMRARLSEAARAVGYSGCEIFPKQDRLVSDNDSGSWINMPYFGEIVNDRYAITLDDEPISLADFLDYAEALRRPIEFFETPITSEARPFWDGPPCLEKLVQIGSFAAGQRNNLLFQSAVYAIKSAGERWRDKLQDINQTVCDPPLSREEVEGVAASVARKKGYRYRCRAEPLSTHCDSRLCRVRPFGVGRDGQGDGGGEGTGEGGVENESFPRLGQLRKLLTDPPVWFWDTVSGRTIELSTEELQSPRLFQKKCMEKMNLMPVMPNQQTWTTFVNEAMSRVLEIDAPEDSSDSGQVWEMLEKFCTGRVQAQSKKEVLLGKPWTTEGVTWFRMQDFRRFLDQQKFRGEMTKTHELASLFHKRGLLKDQLVLDRGKFANVWGTEEFSPQPRQDVPDSISKEDKPF
jgi:hypothetical protein